MFKIHLNSAGIYELMKLKRFVTMVFDLQHKFVGQNPLSKVFFHTTFQEFNLLPSSGEGCIVRTTVFFILFFLILQQSCRDRDSNPQTFSFVSSLDYQSGTLTTRPRGFVVRTTVFLIFYYYSSLAVTWIQTHKLFRSSVLWITSPER